MSWKTEVEGIERRRKLASEHGGAKAVEQQHALGRLTIRERIAGLLDDGSFREQGSIAGASEVDENGELVSFAPANYVLGLGEIDGRPCAVGGEDFTQRGGSPSPAGLRKSIYAEEIACDYRVPLIRFLQGGGGSVAGTTGKRPRTGGGEPVYTPNRFASIARAMATAPVVSAAVGAVAGFPAARLVASHFAIMTRHTAQVLIAGPAVVERAVGESLTKEELGGAAVHARSGVVDNVVEDEVAAFEMIRRFLSYLPTNVGELAPHGSRDDDPERCEEALLSIIPRNRRQIYDMRKLLAHVVDAGSLFEMTSGYGRAQITAFARLDGQPVGVLANDTRYYAGSMTADGGRKVRRFVDLCDTFHLPIVSFVDEPGFMIGSKAEEAATIRFGAEALFAVVQSTVPWASVIVRKTYGVAAAAHFGPGAHVLSWPSAEGGALPLEGGIAVAFRREIEAAPDPEEKRRELEARFAGARSPFPRAESFGVNDLIDPRRTRPALCDWIRFVQPRLRDNIGPRSYAIRP
ncbi:MAG: propionyl-CoA carboxylase [Myxococcales bacterium]|nr:propionyl-CoA carboxylase [Myxococcales bacterium]